MRGNKRRKRRRDQGGNVRENQAETDYNTVVNPIGN